MEKTTKLTAVNTETKLTLMEKLDFVPAGLGLIGTILTSLITGLGRGKDGTSTYRKHVRYAVIRRFLARLSVRQFHYIYPSTAEMYERAAKKIGFTPNSVQLEHGAQGHWLGDPDAKNVFIYYHGGGYVLAANMSYFELFSDLVKEVQAAGKSFSIFFVSYTLAPEAQYPVQLRQSVEALRYILNTTGRDPSSVFIGGDSAGGHATFGILSHISHPHPSIEPLPVTTPLGGALAIAPWISLDRAAESYFFNAKRDYISKESGVYWAESFMGTAEPDNYNQALGADPTWWADIKTKSLLIVVGSHDVLLTPVTQFVEKLKPVVPFMKFEVCDGQPHVGIIINRVLGDKSDTQMNKAVREFFIEKI